MEQHVAEVRVSTRDLDTVVQGLEPEDVLSWCEQLLLDNADTERLADLVETILAWDPTVSGELEHRRESLEEDWD